VSRSVKAAGPTIDGILMHGSRRIPYQLHLGNRRGLRISVTPRLEVRVFAPRKAPRKWIESAIRERASWIAETLDRVAACDILSIPERYSRGESIRLAGVSYRLVVTSGERAAPEILLDALIVRLPDPEDTHSLSRLVTKWYREQAECLFDRSLARCMPALRELGVVMPTIRIRNMRSRWGSCSSDGRVTLNLKLAMTPEAAIDYVVMHELCHLVHHDHSKRYYALLAQCMPDWRERRSLLSGYRLL